MGAGPTIGTIRGTIEIDYDSKGIIRAQADVEKIDKKSKVTAGNLAALSRNLALFGGTIAAGFAVAANSAISFEKRMSAIKAVSGATADEMDKLSKKALQLGADTKFSASDAAVAMEELVKAGLSVSDVLNGAADAAVNLAAAGEIDLPQAATISANALNQFGLKAEDLVKTVDTIAGAANASAIDVSEFGMALSQVGAVAHLAGQTFDDTATAIALLGNAGIKGSDAGTSLKTFLNNLIPTTNTAKKAFEQLGLAVGKSGNAFIDEQGNFKSLGEIAGILHDRTKNLTESQKSLALETIFGSDAIRAASVIAEQGATGFKALNDQMHSTTAAEVAATRMDNTAGSIEQLKGSAETLAISLGKILIPGIREAADTVTGWLNSFSELDKGTQKTILTIAGITAGVALAAAGFVKVVQAVKALQTAIAIVKAWQVAVAASTTWAKIAAAAQWLWNIAVAAFPVILIIAAIAAVIAALVLLFKKNEKFRKVVLAVWAAIKKAFQVVAEFVMKQVWPAIKTAFEGIVKAAKWLWGWITKIFGFIVAGIKGDIMILQKIWGVIGPAVKAAFSLIVSIIKTAWTIISAIFSVIVTVVKAVFGLWWKVISTNFKLILGIVKAVWGFIGPYIIGAIKMWWDYVQFVWNALVSITTTIFNAIKGVILAVWGVIGPYVIGTAKAIWDFLVLAWNTISDVAVKIWNGLKDFFVGVWDFFVTVFKRGVETVTGIFEAIKAVVDKVRNFFSQLKAAADGGVGSLIAFVKQIPGKILDALGNLAGMLFDSGKKMIQGLIDGINSMVDKATGSLRSLLKALRNLLPFSPAKEGPFSGKGWTFNSGTALIEDFAKGIDRASQTSLDSLMGAVSGVAAHFTVGAASPAAVAPPSSATAGVTNIGSVNVKGVWDFTDPMATRKMVGQLDSELTLYKKGYK